jgi:NADPH:quinone reductase-like Zn-dependent oxidoreductase
MNKGIQVRNEGGVDKLVFSDIETCSPNAGEVKVRWHATSLNYHDYLVANGTIPVKFGRIPMSDGAGEIIELGQNVKKWKKGDKVMSLFFPKWDTEKPTEENTSDISGETVDGYAQYYSCLPESQITAIPSNYTYAEASSLPCAAVTAWRALVVEGNIKPGESVLIEGTGGMSIFALQIALSLGAEVFATTGSQEKKSKLKQLGVKEVVNYKDDLKWGKTIYHLSNGGVDHVLDVGGKATMRNSIDAVKMYGNIYSIGILGGPMGEILYPKLFFKHIHLIGLAVGSAEMQNAMVASINKNQWKPIIDRKFELEELAKAFKYQESGAHFGKIVVEW